jgi:superfamily II DNA or RNA helicase
MNGTLTRSGIFIKFSEFERVYGEDYLMVIGALTKKFKLIHTVFKTHAITLNGYKTTRIDGEKYLKLPRFGFFDLCSSKFKLAGHKINPGAFVITNQIKPNRRIDRLEWTGAFKGNQKICFDTIMATRYSPKSVAAGKAGLILNLEAGQGKTFVAMSLINATKHKTMIVTHTKTILYQWVDVLKEYFPQATIGIYHGEYHSDGDIVVSIINSLLLDEIRLGKTIYKNPLDYFAKFGMLIIDESHEYCAQGRGSLFWKFQCPYMLGLSATPNERGDAFDPYVHWQMGSVINARDLPGYTEKDIPFRGSVKLIKYLGPNEYTESVVNEEMAMVNSAATINRMIGDPYRLHVIAVELQALISDGHNTFIFADRRDYLDKIKTYLSHLNIANDIVVSPEDEAKVMKVVGGASADEVQAARDSAIVILTTYQYAGTGCSIPKMNAVILATPRKSKSRQTINRIFRLDSDYSVERKIIDLVDWMTVYKSQWYKRKVYYQEKKYPITVCPIEWQDIRLIPEFADEDAAFRERYGVE